MARLARGPASPAGSSSPVESFTVGGLRVLLRPAPGSPVVAARLYVRGGAANTAPGRAGIEALLGRAARRGTQRFPKAALNDALARLGADLGSAAGLDLSVFTLRCLRRDLDEAWGLFTEVIGRPLLEPAEVDIVRQQMLLERRHLLDSPDGALGERAQRHCFAGHPYAAVPAGTETSLPALDTEALRAHAARFVTRANTLLVLAADVDASIARQLADAFTVLPAGTPPVETPPRLRFVHGELVVEDRPLPTNYVLGQYAAPSLGDPDYPAALLAISVLRDRFFEEVRTKRNLSYAPGASLAEHRANLGSIYVSTVDPVAAMQVMRAEMRKLVDVPLPAGDLADKVCTFVTRYHMRNETNQAQAGFLASYELHGGGWERAAEFIPRLEAVRPEDVQRVAGSTLRHIQYVYLGDPARAERDAFTDP